MAVGVGGGVANVAFLILALLTVVGAILTVSVRNAVHAALDLHFDQARESGFVQLAVFERGNDCGVGAGEHHFGHSIKKTARFGEPVFCAGKKLFQFFGHRGAEQRRLDR